MALVASEVTTGRPSANPTTLTDPVQSSSSRVSGPTRGPYSISAPDSPPVPFASVQVDKHRDTVLQLSRLHRRNVG